MLFCQSGSNDSLPAPKNRFLSVSGLEATMNLDVAFSRGCRRSNDPACTFLPFLGVSSAPSDTLADATMESLGDTSYFLALSMLSEIFDARRRHICRSREQGVESYATVTPHLIHPDFNSEIESQ